jgi:peptidyl-prolyl cis-trans isomerase C
VVKDPIATVDGQDIKAAEVEKVVEGMVSQRGGTLKDVPDAMKPMLYRNVVEGMIAEKLVTRESSKIEVTDADVTAELDRFKKQFPDEKTFNEQLASQGQNAEGVKKDIFRFIQQNRWMEEQVKGKTAVTDEEAQTFYKENPEQFQQPEQVRASHILVKVDKDAKDDVVKTKRDAASKILDRVKKGEDFDKLASELSEDPSAKQNKGDLDFFGREQMVPEFSTAAFKMKKGDVSANPFAAISDSTSSRSLTARMAETSVLKTPRCGSFQRWRTARNRRRSARSLRGLRESAKVTINLPEAPAPAAPAAPEGQ